MTIYEVLCIKENQIHTSASSLCRSSTRDERKQIVCRISQKILKTTSAIDRCRRIDTKLEHIWQFVCTWGGTRRLAHRCRSREERTWHGIGGRHNPALVGECADSSTAVRAAFPLRICIKEGDEVYRCIQVSSGFCYKLQDWYNRLLSILFERFCYKLERSIAGGAYVRK